MFVYLETSLGLLPLVVGVFFMQSCGPIAYLVLLAIEFLFLVVFCRNSKL